MLTAAAVAVAGAVGAGILIGRGGSAKAAAPVAITGRDAVLDQTTSTDKYKGYPLVLNIWASWCGPCNLEAPDVRRFVLRHPNVRVVGIDFQDTRRGAHGFYVKWQWVHPSIADPSGDRARRLGLPILPTTYFTDAQHRIVGRILGPVTLAQLERGLAKALKH